MPLLDSVETTLDALDLGEQDAAAAELARTYARQMDAARSNAARADRALREVEGRGDDVLVELVQSLRARLSERDTIVAVGGRLGPLLDQLHATPKSRGAKVAPATGPAGPSPLAGLRAVPSP